MDQDDDDGIVYNSYIHNKFYRFLASSISLCVAYVSGAERERPRVALVI